ncbi:hypothetical protein [Rhodohalobacter sp. 8-1]|uniref:hypothetical protein n=1 Tax=Rhodohalobacter sp. 8-1 TaxID=3131972 RepID=UPI0030ED4D88
MKKIILFFLLALFSTEIAEACICERQTLEERIEEHQFIFVGKVLSVKDIYTDSTTKWPDRQRIVLEIENKFKGNKNEKLAVHSVLSSCASYFEKGKKYLVFADHKIDNDTVVNEKFVATNDKIVTGKCYGTKEVKYLEEETRKLEKIFKSKN